MEDKILEIIKEESENANVRKYTCINGFGYSQFERNIAERVVKLFYQPVVVCCALCNTELEDYEKATCRQMGATDSEMICETCWNRIQNEGYENVMP